MEGFRFSLIDTEKKRISSCNGWSGLLFIASYNYKTIEDYAKKYEEIIEDPLYLEQYVSEDKLKNPNKSDLLQVLATCERPLWVLEKEPLDKLVEYARSPDYRDYKPNQRIGTSIKPTKEGVPYDGVVIIDLRTKDIFLRGHKQIVEPGEKKKLPKKKWNEPHYEWFGFLSDIRMGKANIKNAQGDIKTFPYQLDPQWTINDLRTGNIF